ncbi:MAG TPA: phosphoenolpyruvate carboxykinase (ATP) [Bryobacteraceae bacterium]|nr:phosphoenolpyruvate carboxykinase (ATP) [Bryobacteraceae bacterium]
MRSTGVPLAQPDLREYGIRNIQSAYWNFETSRLIEEAILRGEGTLAEDGALVVRTGQFTGRSPKDKYIVQEPSTEETVNWGSVNQPMSEEQFDRLYERMLNFWEGHELFVQDCFAGADPAYALPIRVIAQRAWHSLFARQLFVRPDARQLEEHVPAFTVFFAPTFRADPKEDHTHSETCIALNFKRKAILIAGTEYAGEVKKSIFTVLNHLLPDRGVLPMHCSANIGADGKVALFFGLSGTGKTTLSADPSRRLIGDDEHGWSDRGIFNFEGGCYAKCIHLSKEKEPQIWNAIRYGTVLENVMMDPASRRLDFDSAELTENTRAAYPIEFIDNAVREGMGGQPSYVLFLAADAFGVLPAIARLTTEQATYHFLSGYTAKVAGTERGLGKEPAATFSACFADPFLTRHPKVYADMLGEKMRQHNVRCYLVNTGWTGGGYGVGERMGLPYTRAMVNTVVTGQVDDIPVEAHPVFQVLVPKSVPGVPAELLDPRAQWSDVAAYDRAARELKARFEKNFAPFRATP